MIFKGAHIYIIDCYIEADVGGEHFLVEGKCNLAERKKVICGGRD